MIPITITATVAAWAMKGHSHNELLRSMENGNSISAISALQFYGPTNKETFSDCIRVGEADITVRLFPKDEQTRLAVQALQAQLSEERVKWHQRQEAILAEISKLTALTFDEATA